MYSSVPFVKNAYVVIQNEFLDHIEFRSVLFKFFFACQIIN